MYDMFSETWDQVEVEFNEIWFNYLSKNPMISLPLAPTMIYTNKKNENFIII